MYGSWSEEIAVEGVPGLRGPGFSVKGQGKWEFEGVKYHCLAQTQLEYRQSTCYYYEKCIRIP